MRRAVSLLALAGSLALAATQPAQLTLSSIKALDTTDTNKDQWNFKGQVDGADNDYVLAVGEFGITAELEDQETLAFSRDDDQILGTMAPFPL